MQQIFIRAAIAVLGVLIVKISKYLPPTWKAMVFSAYGVLIYFFAL